VSPLLALRLVTYLTVADGIAALLLAGLIAPLGAALVGAAILASWWLERARERGTVTRVLSWVLVVIAAGALAMDLLYFASTVLDGMVHVLLFVILARLIMSRSLRDLRDAGFLSFFLLVATASVTFSMGFLAVFIAYLALATWMMMLNHIVSESDQAGRHDLMVTRLGLRGQMIRVSLAAAAGTFTIAGVLFFLIPRVEQATLPLRAQFSRMVTGFSDRVDLGSFGDIETDKTVVMRVQFRDDGTDPNALPNLRWRGIGYDSFDGRTWSVGRPDRRSLGRSSGAQFVLGSPRGRGPVVRQEVYLDPIGTDIIFAAPRPLRLDLRAGTITLDDMGSVSVPTEAARLHYVVESELETPPPPGTRVSAAGAALPNEERRRFLQLPELPPDIARLARDATAGSRDPLEAASRLTLFLSTNYTYSLSKKETTLNPLQEFLFHRRSGNCEYFSAALAVMLRSLGIPARVVGGFQRGEWNPYGRYFMVRLSDAHAWVEAYFDGLGWVTFDPSPRMQPEPRTGPWALSLQLDAARMRWYRYVVNWSVQDQRGMVSTVQRQAQDFRLAFAWPRDWRARSWLTAGGSLLAAAGLLWLARHVRRRGVTRPSARMPRFYQRALRQLARHGLALDPAETARQFCGRAGAAAPACAAPLTRITGAYERARFGALPLSDAELSDVERCLVELEKR
jgi:transglutaminase-like putative cysteine protease